MSLLKFLGITKKTELDKGVSEFLKFYTDNKTTHFNLIKNENCIIQIVNQQIYVSTIENLELNNDLFIILTFNKNKNNSSGYLSNFKESRFYQLAQYIELGGGSYFIGVQRDKDVIVKLVAEILCDVFESNEEQNFTYQLMR